MKNAIIIFLILAPMWLLGAMDKKSANESANTSRACTPATGNVADISTSTSSSTAFAQLNANSVYLLRCDTEVYIATGATSPTASSNNFPMPTSVFPILTNDTVRYVAGKAVSANGTCWIWECN